MPFKPSHFPYLFIFADSQLMLETGLTLLWGEPLTHLSGSHLLSTLTPQELLTVLNTTLQVTVGDPIKTLSYDR